MPERRRIAIVPARNEEAAVAGVVGELRAFDPELDVVVIDDASTDATAERAAAAGAAVLRLPFNLGIGGAVQTGFKFALQHGYEIVVRLDGDGQHDPQEIPSLLAPLWRGEADVVVGSRFAGGNGNYKPPFAAARRDPLVRAPRLAPDRTEADRHDLGLPGRQRRAISSSPRTTRTTTPRWRRRSWSCATGSGSSRSPCGCAAARPASRRLRRSAPLLRGQGDARPVRGVFRRRIVREER